MSRSFSALKPLWFACAVLLAGCTVGPNYQAPELKLPSTWHEGQPGKSTYGTQPNGAWWQDFNDPALTKLIERALAHNHTLAIAAAKITEVRGLRESAFGKLFPQIGAAAEASSVGPGAETVNNPFAYYQEGFDATWEIDLFGGTRREVEAEDASAGAAQAAYRDASLSLAAEVAREYILLRQFQAQLAVTQQTVDIQRHLYDITRDHYKGGLVSTLDVAQAETLYKSTAARIPDFERQITASSYRLSVLLGENPGSVDDVAKTSAPIPAVQTVPVLDAPADIIRHRPDVAAAERSLAAATALQGVAVSKLYPKISISALIGSQRGEFDLYRYNATHQIWDVAGDASFPLLNFGAIQGQINAADARQVQALHHYKQTVLAALGNIETDISDLSKETKRDEALRDAGKSADHAVDIARDRYRNGLTDFTTVLQAEQQRFSVKLEMIASQSTVAQDVIALHKALGDSPVRK